MKLGKFKLNKIYCGDCFGLVKDIPDNSIDLIVTDPPYGIGFMDKDWDKFQIKKLAKSQIITWMNPHMKKDIRGMIEFFVPIWKECLRILKSGSFAFIMSSTRQDVLMTQIQALTEAGFNTSFTSIYWTYASGFPKAGNIGKMVDKRECKKQLFEKLGRKPTKGEFKKAWKGFREIIKKEIKADSTFHTQNVGGKIKSKSEVIHTKGTSELEGSYGGFQPKPAVEIIIVAMKPLSEKTYIDQALKNKKGITWLDDCKIPYKSEKDRSGWSKTGADGSKGYQGTDTFKIRPISAEEIQKRCVSKGRFPANLLVSDDVLNDGRIIKAGSHKYLKKKSDKKSKIFNKLGDASYLQGREISPNDSGSFSRYFDLDKWAVSKGVKDTFPFLIVSKASKSEKNKGLEGLKDKASELNSGGIGRKTSVEKRLKKQGKNTSTMKNFHPTVKPIKLMSYLIMLGSRKGDIILDNFCGSGSTLIAAKKLNRRFLGFDNKKEYIKIANARLNYENRK